MRLVQGPLGPLLDITPRVLTDAMAAGGDEAKRAFEAMMPMKKIDVATIEAARRGAADTLGGGGEWHRIVPDARQRAAAADPPQPIEHRAKQQQDRQRAHRAGREGLGKDLRHALADREERSGRDEEGEAHPPEMARQARPAARHAGAQMRTSPAAARIRTVARMKDITPIVRNGTPRRKARAVDDLHAAHDRAERKSDRDRQCGNVDTRGSTATRGGRWSGP